MRPESGGLKVTDSDQRSKWWQEFKQEGNPEAREKLILAYVHLVKYVAGRVAIGLPPNVEFDDLVSYGIIGLVDSIAKFDPERGVKFETYAISRIRGAMIDGLRSVDWVPRSVRRKAKELDMTIARLEGRLGRSPTDEEICEELGLDMDDYCSLLMEVSCTTLTSLDDLWSDQTSDSGVGIRYLDLVEGKKENEPEQIVELAETKRLLATAIDALPERERLIIALYYYEGLTLREIGEILDISESRVCQIHSKVIACLRAKLNRD